MNTTITPSSDLEVMQALLHYMLLMAFIADEGAFNNLDINEVKMTVLKDAAAAVYGARAAYGVVLVKN